MLNTPFKNPFKIISYWILKEYWENYRSANNNSVIIIEGLQDRVGRFREEVKEKQETIDRLNDLCNKLKEEAFAQRGYVFDADRLTEAEQFIIGKSIKHELIGLFKKMFKQYADLNADLLMHGQKENDATRAKWELAVRIYDDLVMQLQMCEKIYSNKARLKALERKNAQRKKEQR